MKHDKCHRTRNATTTAATAVVGWMKTETPGVVVSNNEIEMAVEFLI